MSAHVTPERPHAFVAQVMGMPISVHVRGPGAGAPAVADAAAAVFAELREVESTFSTFRPDTAISRLDRGELRLVEAPPDVLEVIGLCEEARRRTGGAFDPRLPGPDGRLRYDPAGLVKGWAAERAFRHLAALPAVDAYLNAGGDIRVACADPAGAPWRIGIEHPLHPERLLGAVELVDGAIATSGTAHRGRHIVDPDSGLPTAPLASVTVVGPSLLWADVLATAAFVRGPGAHALVAGEEGYEALVVDVDGAAHRSRGFRMAGDRVRVPAYRPVPAPLPRPTTGPVLPAAFALR